MNIEYLERKWGQANEPAIDRRVKVLDQDKSRIKGNKEQLFGSIRERHGLAEEECIYPIIAREKKYRLDTVSGRELVMWSL